MYCGPPNQNFGWATYPAASPWDRCKLPQRGLGRSPGSACSGAPNAVAFCCSLLYARKRHLHGCSIFGSLVSITIRGEYSVPIGTDVLGGQKSVLEILTMFHHCCATATMSYFKAKMHQIRFRLGSALTPLGELIALPRPPSWI